jgi:hypothetical protein
LTAEAAKSAPAASRNRLLRTYAIASP